MVNLLMLRDPTCKLVLSVVFCSFDSKETKQCLVIPVCEVCLAGFSMLVPTAVVVWVGCFSVLVPTAVVVLVGCVSMLVVCFCQRHKGSSGLVPRPDH